VIGPTGGHEQGSARVRVLGDLVWIGGTAAALFILAVHFGLVRRLTERSADGAEARSDAAVLLLALLAIGLVMFGYRRWRDSVRMHEQVAARRALYDPLTGLPNRILLHEHLTDALARSRRSSERVAVLFLDLDQFKSVNDRYGHAVGDHLLGAVADRLREAVRGQDLLARLGGDEFVVVCQSVAHSAEVEVIADRLSEALSFPFRVKKDELEVSTSIGIAVCETSPKRRETAETLLQDADAAMSRAKAEGPGARAVFDRTMRADRVNRSRAEEQLREALDEGRFRLIYQPILTVADERIVGVEALLRLQDPKRGQVSPAEFVPELEENGLIVPVGEWALETACRQVKRWHDDYPSIGPLRVSVNVSPRQLLHANFSDVVTAALHRTGAHPQQLCLEITEAALMGDVVAAWSGLRKVKALGVALAIDDFGTGYSSVSYVRNFALDDLKIDQSFVRGLANGVEDAAIVKAVIHMAHALGLSTVAEGVETAEQLAELRALGCDRAQGFYFSRPQPPEVIERLLVRGGGLSLGDPVLTGVA
jgi:diguanylate cyclase (GGDEF)-like protein